MSLELTGKQLKGLQLSLMKAFPSWAALEQLALYELDLALNEVAAPGPLTDVATKLIQWAVAQGKLEELIAGARGANDGNPDLKAFVVEIGLFAGEPPLAGGAVEGQLQALVVEGPGLAGVSMTDWRTSEHAAERSICRLESGSGDPVGTGFLVAADVVMTNGHVADIMKQTAGTPQARFDHQKDSPVVGGTVVPLADQNWELVNSPPQELDYALLQLASRAGETSLLGAPRGWLTPDAGHDFVKDEPILIVHHPGGALLQISAGYLRDLNHLTQRIAYTVNTEPGSSGSPCFSMPWDLIALHHQGDQFTNHAIPMKAIMADLTTKGLAGLVV